MNDESERLHVLPESIRISDLERRDGYLRATVSLELCATLADGPAYSRFERFTVVVDLNGDDIRIEERDSVLDLVALTQVAECVAAKLRSEPWNSTFDSAQRQVPDLDQRWWPSVCVSRP